MTDGANTNAAGRGITPATGNDDVTLHAPASNKFGPQSSGNVRSFDQFGDLIHRKPAGIDRRPVPAATFFIKPQGPGRIGHFRHLVTRQAKPDIVLGQQDGVYFGKDVGFMFLQPQHFRCCHARHGRDTGPCPEIGQHGIKFVTLGLGTAVIPQNCRAQRFVIFIKQSRAMHLSGQANCAGGGNSARILMLQGINRAQCRVPPVIGVLFAPERVGIGYRQRNICLGNRGRVFVNQQCLDGRCADINSEIHFRTASRLLLSFCPAFHPCGF